MSTVLNKVPLNDLLKAASVYLVAAVDFCRQGPVFLQAGASSACPACDNASPSTL